MKRIVFAVLLTVALTGCVLPTTRIVTGSARPTLRLIGSPKGSELLLDGRNIGAADAFDGVQGVLAIEEGPHVVEVRNANVLLVKQRIYAAEGESVSVDVSAGGTQQ
ncbi:MAG: lipoprotein [Janthinobacterium lividum]